jgi:putative sigma-54 modulation protein
VQIKISTRHGHLSDATQQKIDEKLEKLSRFYDRISSIEVTIDLERRENPSVDLNVTAKQKEFVATSQAGELLMSIDQAVEKMEQQLRKHKEKVQDRHRNTGHRQQATAIEPRPEIQE